MKHFLWDTYETWKTDCTWVELSREVSLQTPHHSAFPDMEMDVIYNYDRGDIFQAHVYKMPGQYGTHIDAPVHMNEQGASLEAFDAAGAAHYPGWTLEALRFLREERNVLAIGHEPADTDPAVVANSEGWIAERYWLGQNRYQVELMANLDRCPESGGLIFCTFPKIQGGSGSTCRCFALIPNP